MTEVTREELEELLETLESIRGRHTELITVYVPEGYDINSVQRQLEAEKSTAKNIKSTATRKNVIEALEKIIRHLKTLKKTPKNGLALFSGNVSRAEGQQDLKLWDIEPYTPLKSRLYRCDKEFVLEPFKEMLEVSEVFGLLVMDRKEATIGLLEGKRIEVMQKMTSGVPSKVRAGGQCLSPDTLIMLRKETKKIGDIRKGDEIKALNLSNNKIIFTKVKNKWKVSKEKYLEIRVRELPWDIVASDDHTFFKKENGKVVEVSAKDLSKGDYLVNTNDENEIFERDVIKIEEINKKLGMIDIETESKNFFANWNLVHNSSQRFHRITEGLTRDFYKRIAAEMKKIFFDMPKLKGIIVGGPIPTKDEFIDGEYLQTQLREKVMGKIDIGDASESGLKELVEKSKDILEDQERIQEKRDVEKLFESLGKKPDITPLGGEKNREALKLGAVEILFLSSKLDKNLIKELTKMAQNIGSKVKIISTDTPEGEQFYNLGGIGSILRFRI